MKTILTVVTALITGLFFSSSAIAQAKDEGGFSHEVAREIRDGADALLTVGDWDTAEQLELMAKACNRLSPTNGETYKRQDICGVNICEALGDLFNEATDDRDRLTKDAPPLSINLFNPDSNGYSAQCNTTFVSKSGDLGWL
jgi:hypothetical protein